MFRDRLRRPHSCFAVLIWSLAAVPAAMPQSGPGYYRYPAIHGDTVVFTAEGDLWQVGAAGGLARRLTTHLGEEAYAAFSPDGKTIAFSANYEGPTEVYTMPAEGGQPRRRTFDGGTAVVVGWTPDGKILYTTRSYSTLPDDQLVTVDRDNRAVQVPLSQAAQGVYDPSSGTLFFTRLRFQGSYTKRYKGGTVQNIWKFTAPAEAVPLTSDYAGTSKDAMWWRGRVYFLSDRDGSMNLWSMNDAGKGLKQHTRHRGWDVQSPSLSNGRIVYKLGPDLRIHDIGSGQDRLLPVDIAGDFDHLRERWVSADEDGVSVQISPDGNQLLVSSRGKVLVAPVKYGRLIDATAGKAARFRAPRMTADGKWVITVSTESGETEVWKLPANGIGTAAQLTQGGKVLRWSAVPSPDGKWVAHQDKDNDFWLLDTNTKEEKKIMSASATDDNGDPAFNSVRWSADSNWILFSTSARNGYQRIFLYGVKDGSLTPLTSDRYNSVSATWSEDGKWIYFLSDRALNTVVIAPWGPRQPEPFFDRPMKLYELPLVKGLRSPFQRPDELHVPGKDELKAAETRMDGRPVEIDLHGIQTRLNEIPAPPGNYSSLHATGKRLCWIAREHSRPPASMLQCLAIGHDGARPSTILENVNDFQVSENGKKFLIRRGRDFYVTDAAVSADALKVPATLNAGRVDKSGWKFSVRPREEFRELFLDAWRLHRDYFYDRKMHGVDWPSMRKMFLPVVDRVRDRDELNDLIAEMVAEISALHTFVRGGDVRRAPGSVEHSSLGARLQRDAASGGWRVQHIYRSDPDRPDKRSPLARPGVNIAEGDVIAEVNGRPALSGDIGELLRNQAGRQVLLRVRPGGEGEGRAVVVQPITMSEEADLRYGEWELTRRLRVEESGAGKIGYVHLRAMRNADINQWAEHYYPVYDREGLILDVRHNNGGNIDSWILGKLLRKAWFYWQPRIGRTTWNMPYAFRGHMVILCDEWTRSDGEAIAEGFRRLGLGSIIGTRTWGGEIWLSGSNLQADKGVATAGETGAYGPEGKWLIEGHGVDPDIVIDNLPHETFLGKDAQLDTAVARLLALIREKPVVVPPTPAYPDMRWKGQP